MKLKRSIPNPYSWVETIQVLSTLLVIHTGFIFTTYLTTAVKVKKKRSETSLDMRFHL